MQPPQHCTSEIEKRITAEKRNNSAAIFRPSGAASFESQRFWSPELFWAVIPLTSLQELSWNRLASAKAAKMTNIILTNFLKRISEI
jgi:hypothetical protein